MFRQTKLKKLLRHKVTYYIFSNFLQNTFPEKNFCFFTNIEKRLISIVMHESEAGNEIGCGPIVIIMTPPNEKGYR